MEKNHNNQKVEPAVLIDSVSLDDVKKSAGWTYSVYCHEFPDGRKYVGITGRPVEERWDIGKGYKDNQPMFDAILHCGWDNIKHTIYKTGLNALQAIKEESALIGQFRSTDPRFGFNRNIGRPKSNPSYKDIFLYNGCLFVENGERREMMDGEHEADDFMRNVFATWIERIGANPEVSDVHHNMMAVFGLVGERLGYDVCLMHLKGCSIRYIVRTTEDGIKEIRVVGVNRIGHTQEKRIKERVESPCDTLYQTRENLMAWCELFGTKGQVFGQCVLSSNKSEIGGERDGNMFYVEDVIDNCLLYLGGMPENKIHKHLCELRDGGQIIETNDYGYYYVNPKYVVYGSISDAKYQELVRKANEQCIKTNTAFEEGGAE